MSDRSWTSRSRGEFRGALDVALDFPLASLGSRGLAALLDYCLLTVLIVVIVLAATFSIAAVPDVGPAWVIAGLIFAVFLVNTGYFLLSELLMRGSTFGKKALKLRVVTLDGAPPGLTAALIRNLLRVVDLLPSGYGIGAVAVLMTRRSQRLGDLAAGTVVVMESGLEAGSRGPALSVPASFGAEDIAVAEAWFARRADLEPAARGRLAQKMRAWLEAADPVRARGVPADSTDESFIEHFFASAPGAHGGPR